MTSKIEDLGVERISPIAQSAKSDIKQGKKNMNPARMASHPRKLRMEYLK
jgi:hypothetical protein